MDIPCESETLVRRPVNDETPLEMPPHHWDSVRPHSRHLEKSSKYGGWYLKHQWILSWWSVDKFLDIQWLISPYSAGIDFSRQNLTSVDVRLWRNTAFAHRYLLDHWSWATSRPVHKWMGDRLGLPGAVYTIVGLREPRKSDGSSDWLWVGRKRTSMDVGAVSIRRDPKKSTIWSTWHIYKAMNDIMNDNRPC